MEQDTDKLIKEQFEKLPQPLQRALTLTSWKKLVGEVALGNGFGPDKAEILETEAMLVMYGFESQDDFANNLARELSIGNDQAITVSKDIETKVFSVVLAKANELAQEQPEPTLQSPSEVKSEVTQAPSQVVVNPTPKAPINLISPEPEEPKLEAPKPEASPVSLAKPNSPTIAPLAPKTSEEEKPGKLPETFAKPSAYPQGQDPYREPTI